MGKIFGIYIDKNYSNLYSTALTALFILLTLFLKIYSSNPKGIIVSIIVFAILLLILVIFAISRTLNKGITSLLHKQLTIPQIIQTYINITISLILTFAIIYGFIQVFGWGAILCNVNNSLQCTITPLSYIYFSGITYFSVGYGDLIPTGVNQIIAIINALVGNLFTVIIIAFAINNHKNKEDGKNR